jgi:hypothetical protein
MKGGGAINTNITNNTTYITNLQNNATNIQYDLTSNSTGNFGCLQIASNSTENLINASVISSSANSFGYISGNYSGGSGEVIFLILFIAILEHHHPHFNF